jgi:hydrogenase expression/formation protein HypC
MTMCIGIPMRVLTADAGVAICEGRGRSERIDVALVGAQAAGTWILAHQGRALRTMTPDEAAQTGAALDALDAALAGGSDFDAYFADLVDREPQLPLHLKGNG